MGEAMKTTSIPPNSGPDSLWRQAERAVEEEDAGTPPFAERVARAIRDDLIGRSGGDHYWHSVSEEVREEIVLKWAAIIDRHIREATGVR